VATPANWKDGDDVVISPSIPDHDIPAKFPKDITNKAHFTNDAAA
jgi:hypothetical protein